MKGKNLLNFMQSSLTEQQNKNNSTYATPLSNFRRLIELDLTKKFKIIIAPSDFDNQIPTDNKKEYHRKEIPITLNEAIVISRRINDLYQVDPTINKFKLLLPKEEIQDVSEIIELLLQSTQKEVEIPKDKQKLFLKIRHFLGENDDSNKVHIESLEEAISLLNTNFHNNALQYFSNHFIEWIESGETKNISESILFEIINYYFKKHENEMKKDEAIQIFNKLRSQNEKSMILMHFLAQIDIDAYNDEMLKYFYEHLNKETIKTDITRMICVIRQFIFALVGNNSKQNNNFISNNNNNDSNAKNDNNFISNNNNNDSILKNDNNIILNSNNNDGIVRNDNNFISNSNNNDGILRNDNNFISNNNNNDDIIKSDNNFISNSNNNDSILKNDNNFISNNNNNDIIKSDNIIISNNNNNDGIVNNNNNVFPRNNNNSIVNSNNNATRNSNNSTIINNNNISTSNSISKSKFKITRNSSYKSFPTNIIECKFNGDELSGIIKYLEKMNGEDLEKNNVLKVTGGGFPNSACPITNLLKYDENGINDFYYNYSSQNPKSENDAWIQFDFGKRKINLSSYTIRACCHDISNECKAKSWRIEGSNDGENWDILDHRVNRTELKNKYDIHRFDCQKNDKFYRYIRYTQEETWHTSEYCKYYLHFSCFELFGSILESPLPPIKVKLTNNSYS